MIVYKLQYRPKGSRRWSTEDRIRNDRLDETQLVRSWSYYIKDVPNWASSLNERRGANWRIVKIYREEIVRT